MHFEICNSLVYIINLQALKLSDTISFDVGCLLEYIMCILKFYKMLSVFFSNRFTIINYIFKFPKVCELVFNIHGMQIISLIEQKTSLD